jgi:hypothetical protein
MNGGEKYISRRKNIWHLFAAAKNSQFATFCIYAGEWQSFIILQQFFFRKHHDVHQLSHPPIYSKKIS